MNERETTTVHPWARRLGWGLLLGPSLLIVVMPLDNASVATSGAFLAIMALLVLSLVGQMAGVALLAIAYRWHFAQVWVIVLCCALIALGVALSGSTLQASASGILRRLSVLGSVWGLTAMGALGIAVLAYLILRDKSVPLTMFTFLALIWIMIFYVRQQGPAQLLQQLLSGATIGTFSLFPPLICLAFWVGLIAPFSFLWHTARLVRREFADEV